MRDAEEKPGESGNAVTGEFDGDPEEGRGEERDAVVGILAGKQGDEQAEGSVIEAEVESEKDPDEDGDGNGEAAILMHDVIDPVAGAEIPEDAADVAEQEALGGGGGVEFPAGVELDAEWGAGAEEATRSGASAIQQRK